MFSISTFTVVAISFQTGSGLAAGPHGRRHGGVCMCFATGCRGGKNWGGMRNINHFFLFVSVSFVFMLCIFFKH